MKRGASSLIVPKLLTLKNIEERIGKKERGSKGGDISSRPLGITVNDRHCWVE
jgi:hypothetical protein